MLKLNVGFASRRMQSHPSATDDHQQGSLALVCKIWRDRQMKDCRGLKVYKQALQPLWLAQKGTITELYNRVKFNDFQNSTPGCESRWHFSVEVWPSAAFNRCAIGIKLACHPWAVLCEDSFPSILLISYQLSQRMANGGDDRGMASWEPMTKGK